MSLTCSRRQTLQHLIAGVGCVTSSVQAAPVVLPSTDSLMASLDDALRVKQPLAVMVSLQGCAFCKVVRENYLNPLRASGLHVVQVDMRDARSLVDFQGVTRTHDAWIKLQGVKIAPTVLFYGAHGREVAARLTGAYLPDFYGAYLDEQLVVARRAVAGT